MNDITACFAFLKYCLGNKEKYAFLLETYTQEIIFRNLLFLKPYLGWSLVTQISQMTQIFFFAVY